MKTEIINAIIAKEQEMTLEYLNEVRDIIPEDSIETLDNYNDNIKNYCNKYKDEILGIYIKLIITKKIDCDLLVDLFVAILKETTKVTAEEKVTTKIKDYVSKVKSGILFKITEKAIVNNIIEAYEKEDVNILYSIKNFIGVDIKDIMNFIEQF